MLQSTRGSGVLYLAAFSKSTIWSTYDLEPPHFPALGSLMPSRPAQSKGCEFCNGTGAPAGLPAELAVPPTATDITE